jgi:flagellar biosynthetic protein FliQ
MPADTLLHLLQKALLLTLLLSAFPLLVSLLTGFFLSLLQSVTQIQESTLSFAPKMLAVSLCLLLLGPMMARELTSFTRLLFFYIQRVS